jgi:hypothetical protein
MVAWLKILKKAVLKVARASKTSFDQNSMITISLKDP